MGNCYDGANFNLGAQFSAVLCPVGIFLLYTGDVWISGTGGHRRFGLPAKSVVVIWQVKTFFCLTMMGFSLL